MPGRGGSCVPGEMLLQVTEPSQGSEKGSDGDVDLSITAWGDALGCPTGFKSQGKKL